MSADDTAPVPTRIELDRTSRTVELEYPSGERFALPCQYLRAFSPAGGQLAAGGHGEPALVKESVNIDRIEPVGSYAVRLYFDDGHDTGAYSWATLYRLARNRERNEQTYADALVRAGRDRPRSWDTPEDDWIEVRILYFADVAAGLGRTAEEITTPDGIYTVDALLAFIRERGEPWATVLHPSRVTVTVNRRFAEIGTRLLNGDEISVTPKG